MDDEKQTARRTILDIARYKPYRVAFFVTHRTPQPPKIRRKDRWMIDGTVHLQTAYKRGVLPHFLGPQTTLPRMHALEFDWIMSLLQSRLVVAEFMVATVERCPHTGECLYTNSDGEEMPESCLFDTREQADTERSRIMDLFRRWACGEPAY